MTRPVPRVSGDESDAELLARAIEASGLSARQFAQRLAWRDERTVRRWRTGESPLGDVPREALQRFLALPPRERARLVSLLADDGGRAG